MGWKAIKEFYRIDHSVAVWDGKGICIGSAYIHDIIVIKPDGTLFTRDRGTPPRFANEKLCRYWAEMSADPAKLTELLHAEDSFERDIPVFTFGGGKIIEEQCEALGWPNVTHAGHMMYDNTYFSDREKAIDYAIENARAAIEHSKRRCREREEELAKARGQLAEDQDHLRGYLSLREAAEGGGD